MTNVERFEGRQRPVKHRKSLVAGSALMVTAALVLSSAAYADQLTDAQQKQKSLQGQQQQTKQKIGELSSREASLKTQITTLEDQLSNLQGSIDGTQVDIQKLDAQISSSKQKISDTQKKLTGQYNQLQERIRIMYEDGNASYLEVLFSSTSFTDMLDRLQLLSMIAEQDRKMMQDVEATKKDLDQKQNDLQTQQSEQKRVYVSLLSKQKEQKDKQTQEQQLLGQVHDQKVQEQADLQNENAALASVAATIQSLQSQVGTYTGPASGWVWPVPSCHTISSPYGWRWNHTDFHPGIDIPGAYGSTIVAATSGKVLMAGPASGYGNWVVIESANNLMEIYGHMTGPSIRVHAGQQVSAGQPIAAIGDEGESTGPHLHFEIATGFSGGYPVSTNPTPYVHP
jgi:murein DD-endopeptidase MepM/ murein hydrolase activator NlpD